MKISISLTYFSKLYISVSSSQATTRTINTFLMLHTYAISSLDSLNFSMFSTFLTLMHAVPDITMYIIKAQLTFFFYFPQYLLFIPQYIMVYGLRDSICLTFVTFTYIYWIHLVSLSCLLLPYFLGQLASINELLIILMHKHWTD